MDNIGGGDDDVRKEASAAAFGLTSCQSFLSLSIFCVSITTCPVEQSGTSPTCRVDQSWARPQGI